MLLNPLSPLNVILHGFFDAPPRKAMWLQPDQRCGYGITSNIYIHHGEEEAKGTNWIKIRRILGLQMGGFGQWHA